MFSASEGKKKAGEYILLTLSLLSFLTEPHPTFLCLVLLPTFFIIFAAVNVGISTVFVVTILSVLLAHLFGLLFGLLSIIMLTMSVASIHHVIIVFEQDRGVSWSS
jgi:hypothetical protein